MKKVLIAITALTIALWGGHITFNESSSYSKRVMPEGQGVILSYYDAIKDAKKSVVNISTTKKVALTNDLEEMFGHPLFREFFGDRFFKQGLGPKKRKAHSLGSGVIVSSDGYIITNNHVVENADEILVTMHGSDEEYKAKVIGLDPKTDIAVIKIDANNLNAIKFGDSSNIKEGDIVFAIGNPFGVGESVTQGIVSALNKTGMGINQYENFIQTDASINPGNSGGALVDSRGALIGINSAIITRSGGNNGIGFAIPSNMVKQIAKTLIEKGEIQRGYLGVSIGDLTKNLKEVYDNDHGALILSVEENTPADKAGLKRGDLIIEIDGKTIKNANDLKNIVGSISPNTKIKIKFERDNKIKTKRIKLAKMPGNSEFFGKTNGAIEGLELRNLDSETKYRFSIPSNLSGVLVVNVEEDSKAEKFGFKRGDIIIQVENYEIHNIKEFKMALRESKKAKKRVYVNRKGFIVILVVN